MTQQQGGGNEPNKGFNRSLLIVFVGALVAILAIYYLFSMTREPKPKGGAGRPSGTSMVVPLATMAIA